MLDIVISKHSEIVSKMAEYETTNLYHLNGGWKKLNAQRMVLNEILKEYYNQNKLK